MHKLGDAGILLLYVALIFVLVRPGSQGPVLADKFMNGAIGLVKAATGGGTWSDR